MRHVPGAEVPFVEKTKQINPPYVWADKDRASRCRIVISEVELAQAKRSFQNLK